MAKLVKSQRWQIRHGRAGTPSSPSLPLFFQAEVGSTLTRAAQPVARQASSEWGPGSQPMARSTPHDGTYIPAHESAGVGHLGAALFQEPTMLGVYITWKILSDRNMCRPQTEPQSTSGSEKGRSGPQYILYLCFEY